MLISLIATLTITLFASLKVLPFVITFSVKNLGAKIVQESQQYLMNQYQEHIRFILNYDFSTAVAICGFSFPEAFRREGVQLNKHF